MSRRGELFLTWFGEGVIVTIGKVFVLPSFTRSPRPPIRREDSMNNTTERTYLLIFGILAAIGLATDQASKYVVFTYHYPSNEFEQDVRTPIIPGAFDLRCGWYYPERETESHPLASLRWMGGERMPHVNKGALFGIGNDGGGMNLFFAIVSFGAACFIIAWVIRSSVARDRILCIALGLILGGTLGNLYDRIVFGGVRDFLHWYGWFVWPDFNIADVCLVCGATTLMVHSLFVAETPTEPAPATNEPAAVVPAEPQLETKIQ